MNVVFLSPDFPPQYFLFCTALARRGVRALAVGEAPREALRPELAAALADYVRVPDLHAYDEVHRALGYLTWRHGRIDRVDSLNEHWLPLEARLREDFNVPAGPRPRELARHRSKSGMAEVFRDAGIPHPPTARVTDGAQLRAFAREHGRQLVVKPDVGVGAVGTFRVRTEEDLERVAQAPPDDAVVQPFVEGAVTTFDGLADRDGRVVFAASFVYSSGVMDILNEQLDVFYFSRRELPPALEALGRRTIEAFDVRERFFHAEFFARPDGTFEALEINLRPPGGFTTDLMNYACEVDVYDLWSRAIAGEDLAGFAYERRYYCAHVSRRHGRQYRVPHDELVRALGERLVLTTPMPAAFAHAMGDTVYIVRSPELADLERAFELVHTRA